MDQISIKIRILYFILNGKLLDTFIHGSNVNRYTLTSLWNVLKTAVIDDKLVLKLLNYFCIEKTTPRPRIVAEEMDAV